jgi:hypothetical protein
MMFEDHAICCEAHRQCQLVESTQAHTLLVAENQALSEQSNRLEGGLAAISQEQNERQQRMEKEGELAERQFTEQWLLSEALV